MIAVDPARSKGDMKLVRKADGDPPCSIGNVVHPDRVAVAILGVEMLTSLASELKAGIAFPGLMSCHTTVPCSPSSSRNPLGAIDVTSQVPD